MRRLSILLGLELALALALVGVGAPAASAHAALRAADVGAPTPRAAQQTASVQSITYQGGPVLHANRTHVIFWQPQGSGLTFDPGYIALVEQFLRDVARDSHATANEYGLTGAYGDAGGPAAYASTYGGAVIDTDRLPSNGCLEPLLTGPGWTTCLTDAQLQAELNHVIATDRLPTGPEELYFLLTPDGFGDCTDSSSTSCALGGSATGYCGYHSVTAANLPYAVVPYNAVAGHCQSTNPRPNANAADPALSTISHEQAEMVTDPLGDAWVNSSGSEIADLCITEYGPVLGGTGNGQWDETIGGHHYWLQELYNRITGACEPRPEPDVLSLQGGVRGGVATFSARASVPGGRAIAYRWWFGDGRVGHGRTVHHQYARRGRYRVTVRLTDSAGNWSYASRVINVRLRPARGRSSR